MICQKTNLSKNQNTSKRTIKKLIKEIVGLKYQKQINEKKSKIQNAHKMLHDHYKEALVFEKDEQNFLNRYINDKAVMFSEGTKPEHMIEKVFNQLKSEFIKTKSFLGSIKIDIA